MATTTVQPSESKTLFNLSISYKNGAGETKTAKSEREFSIPEKDGEITVNFTDDDGKTQKTVKRSFERVILKDEADVLAMLQENPYLLISAANYGLDLYARTTIKGPIATEVEGPGKALAKMADQIMASRAKLGKPITKERALAMAKAMADEE